MTELLRFSHEALTVIPLQHQRTLHSMYEDTDLEGYEAAEGLIAFLEQEVPGSFVGVLANSSHKPECNTWEDAHYHCEIYDPTWTTMLISRSTWEKYQEQVKAAQTAFEQAHGCKVKK